MAGKKVELIVKDDTSAPDVTKRIAQRNLREAVRMPGLDTMPGVRLIRRRS